MAASAKIVDTPLLEILRGEIVRQGSISIADYMNLCLSHPQHGYYMRRDPLGSLGDFITAPEISQMFGEIIGATIIEQWQALGAPAPFHLIECGPGRGTLMRDMLRVLQRASALYEALQVHLVEISPVLRDIQEQNFSSPRRGEARRGASSEVKSGCPHPNPPPMGEGKITWHDSLEDVPPGAFALIANEFLDALPIQQYQFHKGQWHERRIGNSDGGLAFILGEIGNPNITAGEGDIFEFAAARENFVKQICGRLRRDKGFALLIDYGSDKSGFGDTLQAVRSHKFADVLENPGQCDLTSHVDFGALQNAAHTEGCQSKIMTQGAFLAAYGINERAQILSQKNPEANVEDDLQRLVAPDQMGELFKVMTITS
jgi:NADH dehydrogenase [ubiquinone] 1 alpha subcomplex assembly factor 7